ncbi:DUF975 family protein [Bacillus sp. REN10]|uniref:DUF975 family protein n=1 Tax=Bacillus sp. REN10 TaxID=2782541 RepID=UPI00193BBE89|nr:DUF975 family protein [Bacillus sp. REN10]
MTVHISSIKKDAREALAGNWGTAVVLMLIMFAIGGVVPTMFEVVTSGGWSNWINQDTPPASSSILSLIISFAIIPLSVSIYWFFLHLVRGERQSVGEVFSVYANGGLAFKTIWMSILIGIFVFLWSLLLIIPGIIKSMSYSQAYFIMKDHPELSALEAISESKRRMKGYKWNYFVLYLSFIGWAFLALFTFGIGYLWLVPYVQASMAAFYQKHIATQHQEM